MVRRVEGFPQLLGRSRPWTVSARHERQRMVSTVTSGPASNPMEEENFAALFEETLKNDTFKEGESVKGKVIHVGKDHVVVDIGYKSEGTIPLYEFTHADASVSV